MKKSIRFVLAATLFAAGYFCGQIGILYPSEARAQADAVAAGPSEETANKIRLAQDNVAEAQAALENEGLYVPAIQGTNTFAVMVGGLDALADLERGQGVDPETFVGLYSGIETEEVAPNLGYDENGLRTYKGNVIRLYSKTRLRQLQAMKEKISTGQ